MQGGFIGAEAEALLQRVEGAQQQLADAALQTQEAKQAAAQAQLQLQVG